VIVSDWGPGIAQEARTAIFDPFYRGAIGLTSRSGTGLGLFLVKQIVEAHGGQVTVDNRAAGATFRLSLPIDARGRKPVVPEPRRAIARRRSMVRLAHVPTSSAG